MRDPRASTWPVRGQPSTSAIGSRSARGSYGLVEHVDALDPVQPEAAHLVLRRVEDFRYQPSRLLISA